MYKINNGRSHLRIVRDEKPDPFTFRCIPVPACGLFQEPLTRDQLIAKYLDPDKQKEE